MYEQLGKFENLVDASQDDNPSFSLVKVLHERTADLCVRLHRGSLDVLQHELSEECLFVDLSETL